jgi:hypothetical protein
LHFTRVAYYITCIIKVNLYNNIEIKIIIIKKIIIEYYINTIIKPFNHFKKRVIALELQLIPLAYNI